MLRHLPTCGRCCGLGLTHQDFWPLTMLRSTRASCMHAVTAIGCQCRACHSSARSESHAASGGSFLRHSPTCVAGCGSDCDTMTPDRMLWHAPVSCSQPRRQGGGPMGESQDRLERGKATQPQSFVVRGFTDKLPTTDRINPLSARSNPAQGLGLPTSDNYSSGQRSGDQTLAARRGLASPDNLGLAVRTMAIMGGYL